MTKERKTNRVVIVFLLFVGYFFAAARPIPRETVIAPRWLSSLESDNPIRLGGMEQAADHLLPFTLGNRFGYVNSAGDFQLNKVRNGNICFYENQWAEYEAEPSKIEIKNIAMEEMSIHIEDPRGYPVLLDGRVFILGSEQNSLSEIDADGNILWTYDFAAPLTCIDAAAGLVLAGSIDGVVEVIDSDGKRIFFFEPGGSRYAVILGCALSRNGMWFGIISGIEEQRFLLLERYGGSDGEFKVIYHTFLETGFRRPVHILFIDNDRRVVFERHGGLGCYVIKSRQEIQIPLDGTIAAIDDSGGQGFFFVICSGSEQQKELVCIKFPDNGLLSFSGIRKNAPDTVFLKAPFKSEDVYLGRTGSMLVIGGGTALISFDLENK